MCPIAKELRAAWNALQQANGTSLKRNVPPSEAERKAWYAYDQHLFDGKCKECKGYYP
jgi:hypothetical protein